MSQKKSAKQNSTVLEPDKMGRMRRRQNFEFSVEETRIVGLSFFFFLKVNQKKKEIQSYVKDTNQNISYSALFSESPKRSRVLLENQSVHTD